MRQFKSIPEFLKFWAGMPGRYQEAKIAGLKEAGGLIETEMRGEIGTYQSGDAGFEDWAPLSAATLYGFRALPGKIADGYAPPDNPLHATGALEESISSTVDGDAVVIGSTDIVALYQDQGTDERGVPFVQGETASPGIPGREFVARAAFRRAPEAVEAIAISVVTALAGGDRPQGRF